MHHRRDDQRREVCSHSQRDSGLRESDSLDYERYDPQQHFVRKALRFQALLLSPQIRLARDRSLTLQERGPDYHRKEGFHSFGRTEGEGLVGSRALQSRRHLHFGRHSERSRRSRWRLPVLDHNQQVPEIEDCFADHSLIALRSAYRSSDNDVKE